MTVGQVSSFLAQAGKSLAQADIPPIEGRAYEQRIQRWPILNASGVDVEFTFSVHYFPKRPNEYTLTIENPRLIWRVACNPLAAVSNKLSTVVPGIAKGRIKGRHYFDWEDNKHMILEDTNIVNHLCYARPLPLEVQTFEDIVSWLFGRLQIQVPPWTVKPKGLV